MDPDQMRQFHFNFTSPWTKPNLNDAKVFRAIKVWRTSLPVEKTLLQRGRCDVKSHATCNVYQMIVALWSCYSMLNFVKADNLSNKFFKVLKELRHYFHTHHHVTTWSPCEDQASGNIQWTFSREVSGDFCRATEVISAIIFQCWLMIQKSLPLSIRFHLGGFCLRERLQATSLLHKLIPSKTRARRLRWWSELNYILMFDRKWKTDHFQYNWTLRESTQFSSQLHVACVQSASLHNLQSSPLTFSLFLLFSCDYHQQCSIFMWIVYLSTFYFSSLVYFSQHLDKPDRASKQHCSNRKTGKDY